MNNKPLFFFLIIFLSLKNQTSLGVDTISLGESLSGDTTISSAGGVFELGFFKPGNSSSYYLGIWYKGIDQTVVWVANREKPFRDKFSTKLKISNRNLVLSDDSKAPIWSTNVRPRRNSTSVRATLLDNGNLVLLDNKNSSEPAWESFDYPTDTWLPEGKIGFNKRTGEKYSFTSWKSPDDPAPGVFSFEPILNDNIVVWNKSVKYWSTGSWDQSVRVFNSIPEMRANHYYDFTFVSNENESYYTYIVINGEFSRFVMDVTGQMKQLILNNENKKWNLYWTQPRHQCQVHAFCGPFGNCIETPSPFCACLKGFEPRLKSDWESKNYLSGCTRTTALSCGKNGTTNPKPPPPDRFLRMAGVMLPEESRVVRSGNSLKECELVCLGDCSCMAYSFGNNAGGCSIWTVDLINLQTLEVGDDRGRVIYIRLAASELNATKSQKRLVLFAAVGSASGSLLLLVIAIVWIAMMRRKEYRRRVTIDQSNGSLVAFGYRDLQTATRNFAEKLGGGGFGSVFKGTLPDMTAVAVKKLERIGQGEKEFRAEVTTIGSIQHVNLVRLRGFCSERANRLLVYDYMVNGSLASHLFNNSPNPLGWKSRYRIALGMARGLVYLHQECRDCIIHCDIKPENILLDGEFSPRVADFGLAKLVGRDFSRVLTDIRGTIGYLAPEWIAGVAITPKADVYSYGMVLFEIVSGRRNSESPESDSRLKYFPSLVAKVVVDGGGGIDVMSLVDPRLEGDAEMEEVERVCRVGCWCIQDDESHRPTMAQVVQILEGIVEVNLPPIPRSLHLYDVN